MWAKEFGEREEDIWAVDGGFLTTEMELDKAATMSLGGIMGQVCLQLLFS